MWYLPLAPRTIPSGLDLNQGSCPWSDSKEEIRYLLPNRLVGLQLIAPHRRHRCQHPQEGRAIPEPPPWRSRNKIGLEYGSYTAR